MMMKKIILIAVAIITMGAIASAQPKAIGGRFGYGPLEASYQHYLGDPNFMEIDLGAYSYSSHSGFLATGTYNWVFSQPDWTPRGNWSWYAGPGVAFGSVPRKQKEGDWENKAMFGIVGQVGLEFQFWFPLQISADVRPIIGYSDGEFWDDVFDAGNIFFPVISIRYMF